jgi:hypothetical protein
MFLEINPTSHNDVLWRHRVRHPIIVRESIEPEDSIVGQVDQHQDVFEW